MGIPVTRTFADKYPVWSRLSFLQNRRHSHVRVRKRGPQFIEAPREEVTYSPIHSTGSKVDAPVSYSNCNRYTQVWARMSRSSILPFKYYQHKENRTITFSSHFYRTYISLHSQSNTFTILTNESLIKMYRSPECITNAEKQNKHSKYKTNSWPWWRSLPLIHRTSRLEYWLKFYRLWTF